MDENTKLKLFDALGNNWPNFVTNRYGLILKKVSKRDWVICCKFHSEDTPSAHFFLANDKIKYPHYKCFGCGVFLNPIDFIMMMENVSFIEASKILGRYVGVEVTSAPKNPKHEAYKDIMTQHMRRYQRELQNQPELLKYLRIERQLTDQTIAAFGIGAVPANEFQYRNDMGYIASRIAFPITDHNLPTEAKVVGMGYRTLKDKLPDWDKSKDPKYINDKNTTGDLEGVFEKGQYLYGYPMAIQAIRKNNFAVVVEGYMDVISLHQSGILNTVGIMGTQFTEKQMDALKSVTSNLIMFLDSDAAGMDNMIKDIPELLKKGFSVKVIRSEAGKDPADLCKKMKFVSADIMAYIIRNAEPAVLTIINHVVGAYEKVVSRERTLALGTLIPILTLCNQSEQIVFQDMIYKRLDLK